MGRKEEPLVEYYNNPVRFAELVNGWIFDGKNYLNPENISDADRRTSQKSGRGAGKKEYRQRYRDIFKQAGEWNVRLFIGTELQEEVDYTMPLRVMDMDVLSYLHQKKRVAAVHRENRDLKGITSGEFLTGITKEDRFAPVITLILYLNERPWDGPGDLHGLLRMEHLPEEAKKYVENYRIHILDVCHTPDEELRRFPSDICFMLMFIKYTKDKKVLADIRSLCGQETIAEDTFDALADYVNEPELWKMKQEVGSEKGRINMCEGLRELMADSKAEGRAEGKAEGVAEGMAEAVLSLLDEKGTVPEDVRTALLEETDLEKLKEFNRLAARSGSVEEFVRKWKK